MLTDEQAGIIIKYLKDVQLNDDQKDRLIQTYWDANEQERKEIARAYAHLFSNKDFVHRLLADFDRRQQLAEAGGGSTTTAAAAAAATDVPPSSSSSSSSLCRPTSSPASSPVVPGSPSSAWRPGSPAGGSLSTRRVHSQMLLRTAIDDQFAKLAGPGPFQISFNLVQSEAEQREVVNLFASQFEHPDPPEIQRLVTLPQACNTRTRRRISGSYTWYIRCLTTKEVVCAVTIIAHHHETHHFVEMPLFATAAGYKKNGFGRLLNAALMSWCAEAKFEFIMISADVQAIPFWKHLKFNLMSLKEKKSIDFYYQHECYKFKGAEPMIGYCSGPDSGVYSTAEVARDQFHKVLRTMTKFVVVGTVGFPEPA